MTQTHIHRKAQTPGASRAGYRWRIGLLASLGLLVSSALAGDDPGFSVSGALQKPAFSHANEGVWSDVQFRLSLGR
ncbi:MAG: hypothetical protein V2I57_09985 [Xanthomonadales bacterium]|jgi:hypothetical protein|nr:hypothetical protein [Xanthomonadales bacterium]